MALSDILEKKLIEAEGLDYSAIDWIGEPPKWDYHLKNNYDEPISLSRKQNDSVIAVIGTDPKKIFSPDRIVSLGVLCIGKGGGKDFLIAIVMDYIITVLLHLKSPQKFLGIEENLDLLNVAIKGKQGERVFFSKFVNRVKQNKFYQKTYKIYEKGKLINNPHKPKGTININSDNANFPHQINCYSESSKNETWEGYNVIFFVLDEISGFISETQRENGWKIYETADTSCISRRTKNFKGIGFVISYPRKEKDDIILELYKQTRLHDHMYGVFAFSWHFKPWDTYKGTTFIFHSKRFNRVFSPKKECPSCGEIMSHTGEEYVCSVCGFKVADEQPVMGIEIPIEYKEKFDKNPEKALTMFCCLPPRVTGEYIEYPDKVWACIDYTQQPMFFTEYYTVTKVVQGETFQYRALRIKSCNEPNSDIRLKNYSYCAWLDNAEVACDAVITIGRKEPITVLKENGASYTKEICRIVDVISWQPLPNLPIDLENVEDFLTKLLPKWLNLKEWGADRWECLSGSSLVNTSRGLIPIRNVEIGEEVSTIDNNSEVLATKNAGKKDVYELTTQKGYRIRGSLNHPFLGASGWVEMKNLSVGDMVSLKSARLFSNKDSISENRAVLYGYLTSEGYFSSKKPNLFSFTNSDEELLDEYEKCLKSEFAITILKRELKKYKDTTLKRKPCWTIRKIDSAIASQFRAHNLTGDSYKKEVPTPVLCGSEKIVRAYLSALFEGDGCVLGQSYANYSQRKTPVLCYDSKIQLETASERLVHQVQMLLLNLGIASNVKLVHYKLGDCYRLSISGECILTFHEKIGFRSSTKKTKLKKVLEVRKNMKQSKNHFKSGFLKDKVKEIKFIGIEDTYDIQVKGACSFVANGFVVHNSALLDRKLKNIGVKTHRFPLGNLEYDSAKYHIYMGSVRIFNEEPFVEKSTKELTSLEQLLALEAGDTKPDKRKGLKKDKSDSFVGVINLLMGNNFKTEKKRPNVQKTNVMGLPRRTSTTYTTPAIQQHLGALQSQDNPVSDKKLPLPRKV